MFPVQDRNEALTDQLRRSLAEAFPEAASEIDQAELTTAITSRNQAAIEATLGVADGQVARLTALLSGGLLTALLAAALESMSRFASANGSRVQLDAATVATIRAELVETVIIPLSASAATTALMLATDDTSTPPQATANVISLFALTLAQAKSIQTFRAALSEAQRSSRTLNSSGDKVLESAPALALMRRFQANLNAAQRSSLHSIITTGISDDVVGRAVSRHTQALARYRMTAAARQEAARALNDGEYRALVQGRQNRSIPRTARRFWITAGDERVRHSHSTIPSMNSGGVDIGEPFETPLGPTLYPPLEVNCRCRVEVRAPDTSS